MPMTAHVHSRAQRWATVLNRCAWAAAAAGGAGWALLPAGDGQFGLARLAGMGVFALCLIGALVAAVLVRRRRTSAGVLLAAVLAWGVGLAGWYADMPREKLHVANWFELAFVLSYLLMGVYLLFDVPRPSWARTVAILDTTILAGAAVTAVGLTFLQPDVLDGTTAAMPRVIAMAYSTFDLLLAGMVAFQLLARQRAADRQSLALLAGFALMAVADAPPAAAWALGQPDHRLLVNACWGAGLAAVVWAATSARRSPAPGSVRTAMADHVPWSVLSSLLAVLALVLRPADRSDVLVTVAAAFTLLLAQVRTVIALRDAHLGRQARALSHTDDLTGLANRRAATAALSAAVDRHATVSVIMLDLDGFKRTNDGLGHAAGDELLRLTARRLRAAAPHGAKVTRLSGDEFAVIVHGDDETYLRTAARRLLEAVAAPANVAGVAIRVGASAGIATRHTRDVSGEDLLRRADVAMYEAKTSRDRVAVYDEAADPYSSERVALADALARAIDAGGVETWFQPQVDARTGDVVGMEALARWRCSDGHSVVHAARFLPLARRAGLMPALQRSIAASAVVAARTWHEQGANVRVAVNVDAAELLGSDFVPFLLEMLEVAGLPAYALTLEVTEDSFVADPQRAGQVLHELAAHQVGVSIDSYGTGFSSLAHLRDLPVSELKIDHVFVRDILTDARARQIVASTASMACALSMRLVAEGVESAAAAQCLRELGVDVLQGYHLGSAAPARDALGSVERAAVNV